MSFDMELQKYSCFICSEKFEEEFLLKLHLLHHAGEEIIEETTTLMNLEDASSYEIDCTRKESLSNEVESQLVANYALFQSKFKALHVCSVCGKEFRRKDHLRKHSMIHTGHKPFTCLVCSKSFARKDRLKDHQVTHVKIGWSCYFCGRMFAQRSIQRKHEMTHRGIKPYSCELCENKFSRKNDLLRHITSHTREKTFFCEVCDKGFTQKRLLKRHQRIHDK